jgi:peptidase E
MNKFILIGGCQEKADSTKLSNAVFSDIGSPINFLICLFAKNQNAGDIWSEYFDEYKKFFSALSSKHIINFVLAKENEFNSQIKDADIVYFSGGDSIPLYSTLARIGNQWVSELKNKIVIGSSAGTDMLSKHNYDIQQNALDDGMGIIPIKTIVHYCQQKGCWSHIDWDKALSSLKEYGEDLPIYPLCEGEFVVI